MPEYLAPGVYVEEVDAGIKPIEGVSTSIAGFVGVTRRGPSRGLPRLVTSFADFERQFGGYFDFGPAFLDHRFLPYAVNGFFTNGGRLLYVLRVRNGGSVATKQAKGGIITRLAPGANVPLNATEFRPESTRGIQVGTDIRLRMVREGTTYETPDLTVTSLDRDAGIVSVSPATITLAPAGPTELESRFTTVFTNRKNLAGDLANPVDLAGRDNTFVIRAVDEGSWGREIVVIASHESGARTSVVSVDATNSRVTVSNASGFYVRAWVEFDRGEAKVFRRIAGVDGNVLTLDGPTAAGSLDPQAPTTITTVTVSEFKLTATWNGVSESYSGLTLENVPGHFVIDRLQDSLLITVDTIPATTDPFHFPAPDDGRTLRLDDAATGTDGAAPTAVQYIGAGDPGDRTGLRALEDIDRISIIAAPGQTSVPVQSAVIEQCERLRDRFAVLDPVSSNVVDVQTQRGQYDSKYAAIYFPRLQVFDPLTTNNIAVPPSGHMAGIYARVDIERGVHKPPANEVVRGIVDFDARINKETQDILNPSPTNINVFRDFRADGRGLRIWGARVVTSDTSWKYINVRRLFIMVEESLDEGTQWVVFEPNDERLWARVRQSISAFLVRIWRDGALMGTKPEEAFFVRCDRTTMTQDDLDNGRLIVLVGIAPVKPAEFVIIRISQYTAGAVEEA